MFKHTVKYDDYNGDAHEKDVYFNISMPEMMKLEHSIPGGYGQYLEAIAKAQDPKKIWETFETLIDISYGEKSPDGQRFIKTDENGNKLVDAFKESPVFEAFMLEILTNDELAAEMVNRMIPEKALKQLENGQTSNVVKLAD